MLRNGSATASQNITDHRKRIFWPKQSRMTSLGGRRPLCRRWTKTRGSTPITPPHRHPIASRSNMPAVTFPGTTPFSRRGAIKNADAFPAGGATVLFFLFPPQRVAARGRMGEIQEITDAVNVNLGEAAFFSPARFLPSCRRRSRLPCRPLGRKGRENVAPNRVPLLKLFEIEPNNLMCWRRRWRGFGTCRASRSPRSPAASRLDRLAATMNPPFTAFFPFAVENPIRRRLIWSRLDQQSPSHIKFLFHINQCRGLRNSRPVAKPHPAFCFSNQRDPGYEVIAEVAAAGRRHHFWGPTWLPGKFKRCGLIPISCRASPTSGDGERRDGLLPCAATKGRLRRAPLCPMW